MTLPIRISEEADSEMTDAARWYELHRAGLGLEFLAAIDTAVARIEENPRIGTQPPGVDDEDVRRVFVKRFPYHLVNIDLPDYLQVLAVAHDRRRPAYWIDRLAS